MEKLLTLIIPTYNMEKYLDHCLTSLIIDDKDLLAQLEVLVVIDGAKDKSSEIAHSYQDAFPKTFRVIDKENGNYGSCINRGLKEATGKYIRILDADDSFNTEQFQAFLISLKETNADLILTPFYFVNENGVKVNYITYSLPKGDEITFDQAAPAFFKQSIQMHAATYKTERVRSINYTQTEGISYTDQEWVFTPLSAVETIVFFDNPVYLYLWGREGQTMDASVIKRSVSHNVLCAKKIVQDYVQFSKFGKAKQQIIDHKVEKTIEGIYHSYLIRFPDINRDELQSFDNFLKEINLDLYTKTDYFTLTGTFCHYVQNWHNNNTIVPSILTKYSLVFERIIRKLDKISRLIKKRIFA